MPRVKTVKRIQRKPDNPTKELVVLGEKIKHARLEKKMTLIDVASAMDKEESTSYLAKIEAGYMNVTMLYLIKIAKVLGVNVRDLISF